VKAARPVRGGATERPHGTSPAAYSTGGSPALQVKRAAGRACTIRNAGDPKKCEKAPHVADMRGLRISVRTTFGGAWYHSSYPTPSGATKPFTSSAGSQDFWRGVVANLVRSTTLGSHQLLRRARRRNLRRSYLLG